jgi:hypothetical protein
MSAVVLLQASMMLALAFAHKPFIPMLAGVIGVTPGFIIAVLAWRGKLPKVCTTALGEGG